MKSKLKRACSVLAAVAAAVSIVPLLAPQPASAAGVLTGAAEVRNPGGSGAMTSGTNTSPFTLRLPALAACTGDTATDFYFVQSYMVPASVDPSTLQFDAQGPAPQDVGANFSQPLWDTNGSPYVNKPTLENPGSPRPKPGEIINIPDFSFGVYPPDVMIDGAYNIGIACTNGPTGPNQMKEFWNTTITVSGGGTTWTAGTVQEELSITVAPGVDSLSAAFTHSSTPASTYSGTATPQVGDTDCTTYGAVTAAAGPVSASPLAFPGLVPTCTYDVVVTATNGVGSPQESAPVAGTPTGVRPAPTGLTFAKGASGSGEATIGWTAPGGTAPTGYSLVVSGGPNGGPYNPAAGSTSQVVTGLTSGVTYTFTLTPQHAAPFTGTAAQVTGVVDSAENVVQDIEVNRPVGALVLTQRCGVYGALDAEAASPGFPALGNEPAVGTVGSAPFAGWNGAAVPNGTGTGAQDGQFNEYPYPVDEDGADNVLGTDDDGTATATYPTHCGVDLRSGKLVTSGPEAGQFFAAHGRINQLTVVDTRDTDPGWKLNGTMSPFTKVGGSGSFSGDHLGWTPKLTDDSEPFDSDLDGIADYDQTVTPGDPVPARTIGGMAAGKRLGAIASGADGLGIAVLDARIKVLIPVNATNGRYIGTLTFSFV